MADYLQPDVVSQRVRFFNGQFLVDQDFIDEQKFHLDRERRQSRMLRLTGISSGLTITLTGGEATVAAGMAVDGLGRHLVLAADTPLELTDFSGSVTVDVHLVHQEFETGESSEGGGVDSARRWDESPELVAVASGSPAPEGPTVLLGQITVSAGRAVSVDTTGAQRSTLSLAGALGVGVGTGDPTSDLEIGDFSLQDRNLTVQAGELRRASLDLFAGSASSGFSVQYDSRAATRGLHVRSHDQDPEAATRLFVSPGGNIGIGTTAPDTSGGPWDQVVDVTGSGATRLAVRSSGVTGQVVAHDQSRFGANPGMTLGTTNASALTFITNQVPRLSFATSGRATFGTPAATAGVDLYGEDDHLRIYRPQVGTAAPNQRWFLTLMQQDNASAPNVPSAGINIRFRHQGRFDHRIEADADGFSFRGGDLSGTTFRPIKAESVTASQLTLDGVTIGERELGILKALADGTLVIRQWNVGYLGWNAPGRLFGAGKQGDNTRKVELQTGGGLNPADYYRWLIRADGTNDSHPDEN